MSEQISVEAPIAEEPSSPFPIETPKSIKLKLSNGDEIDESEVLTGLNHVKEANKRFQDAASERKAASEDRSRIAQERAEVDQKLQRLKDDPWGTLAEMGLDPRTMSEEYLLKALEFELLTPEQKRIHELEQKTKSYEDKETERQTSEKKSQEEAKAKEDNARFMQMKEEATKSYEDKMIAALSTTNLPRSASTIRKIADKLYQSALDGEEIPVEHAVKLVEHEYKTGIAELMQSLDPDQLTQLLGEEAMKKIRKSDISKLKNPIVATKTIPDVKKESKSTKESVAYVDPYDYIKELKKKHGVI